MDTVQLTSILVSDPHTNKHSIMVCACDHLPAQITRVPACLIVNTDPSWKGGQHWLAIYIDANRNVEFFDSYGQPAEKYQLVSDFLLRHSNVWKMNTRQLQGTLSSTCGQFCIYFLLWRSRCINFENIMGSFDKSVDANDILVSSFANFFLNQKTSVYDVDYIVNQCCSAFSPIS